MDVTFIGERITELRLKKGVSEYQMSYDLGHNKNYVRAIDYFWTLFAISTRAFRAEFFDKEHPQMIRKAIDYIERLDDEDMLSLLTIIQAFCQSKK